MTECAPKTLERIQAEYEEAKRSACRARDAATAAAQTNLGKLEATLKVEREHEAKAQAAVDGAKERLRSVDLQDARAFAKVMGEHQLESARLDAMNERAVGAQAAVDGAREHLTAVISAADLERDRALLAAASKAIEDTDAVLLAIARKIATEIEAPLQLYDAAYGQVESLSRKLRCAFTLPGEHNWRNASALIGSEHVAWGNVLATVGQNLQQSEEKSRPDPQHEKRLAEIATERASKEKYVQQLIRDLAEQQAFQARLKQASRRRAGESETDEYRRLTTQDPHHIDTE